LEKATLLLFQGPNKPYRTFTLSKRGIRILLGSAAILALLAGTLAYTSISLLSSLSDTREKNQLLTEQVKSQSEKIGELDARASALEEEKEAQAKELEKVEVLEGKLKNFLGFPEEESGAAAANQGGIPSTIGDTLGSPELADLEALTTDGPHKGLAEILNFLEDEQERMKSVPTLLPVKGTKKDIWISCSFGWRENPFTGAEREFHNGLDIAGPYKTPIIAPADGTVVASGEDYYLGQYIKISHKGGITTTYGHLAKRLVKRGEKVSRGAEIAKMGNTGRSTGTHLHYAVIKDGRYLNPAEYIWDGLNNPLASRM